MSMSGSCAVCVDGVLYLFGGHHVRGNTNRVQFVLHQANFLTFSVNDDLIHDLINGH